MKSSLCCVVLALLLAFPLGAQTSTAGAENDAAAGTEAPKDGALPRSFRGINLGMDLEQLKAALAKDGLLDFRGDRDVSYLPSKEENLVETTGHSFIRRAFFQLRDAELFIMAFSMNTAIVDHYSIFTQFVQKYGEPQSLSPREAVWETDDTRISIERPLTVKYIDKVIFNRIIGESSLSGARELELRQEFINDF